MVAGESTTRLMRLMAKPIHKFVVYIECDDEDFLQTVKDLRKAVDDVSTEEATIYLDPLERELEGTEVKDETP